ncbi:thioredoxin-disulfide reductase [Gluconacetobacter entanii]|uniref:Thioredoxin reductase n=1 Tax=Gluconacetobacter entanii TaxID=108528 RepID=A0ABT3K3Y8_9PROT|nr:thioredoxin-disulfide reductase [Gluconacetobacter entanii]MCW4590133.1 thioredoxin-disulfide reductase [Gluconacetobacter entanii]MCW4593264.1 thioredoxin-disulfide reductase [Gluconacetobacter entanii]NPC88263.1 thioredoxin-disulfide reductase [Gluconacetobacter entanii]
MPNTYTTDLLVIGAGPAGYTAAIYAARASLSPILVAGLQPGGQLMITTDVENYPGFAKGVQGPDLMMQMAAQAEHVGTKLMDDIIVSCSLTRDAQTGMFRAVGDSEDIYLARSIVIATGAQARWLGIPGEQEYQGSGVSACATCDGFFYRGKRVVVIGGGNTAVEEALYLTHHATHVTLIHRRDTLRAEKILQDRLFANPRISVMWNTAVDRIIGSGTPPVVTSIEVHDTVTNALSTVETDGVFVAIGHSPNTDLFKGQIDIDADGYITTTPGSTRTSVPGVFAAGDVQDKIFRQAITAAGTGCMAALEAERFLAENPSQTGHSS